MRVRGMLLAAIAYFILPFDFVPDIIAGLGFADDAALVTAVVALVSAHITPTHRAAAARALDKELPKTTWKTSRVMAGVAALSTKGLFLPTSVTKLS